MSEILNQIPDKLKDSVASKGLKKAPKYLNLFINFNL